MACADCFKGYVRVDKEPAGTTSIVYGLNTYVAEPPSTASIKGIIVFIPDAFGWDFTNNRLLSDAYAAAGFRVYLPDFMEGVSAPVYMIGPMERLSSFSSAWDIICKPYDLFWVLCGIIPFIWRNLPGSSHPRIVKFLENLRTAPRDVDQGLKVGIAGFCWGGKHALMLTHQHEVHLIDSVFTGHPSALTWPDDIDNIRMPISVAVGDKDTWLTPKQTQEMEKALKKRESQMEGVKSEIVVYPAAGHGFTVRIDIKNPKQLEQSLQAEKQATNWFEKTLSK